MATGHAPAFVEKDFSFELGGHKIRGRWDRVDVRALPPEGRSAPIPTIDVTGDVVRPTLPLGDDEWVVVSDYKTGGRDDDDASRKRAKESLQLQLYALAWRATTGRLPDEVSLRFLDTGRVATVAVEPKRIVKARELIVAAAEAGKHVFCEKPIALDLEATDRAIAAVAKAGILFQIGFQRRFDPAYAKAKDLITSGALGTIEHIRDTMRDPGPPPRAYLEVCGGLYRDMTIHNFDCVRWLMGREPREVFAMGSSLVDPMFAELGDVDTSIVSIRFDNDALAVIDNSRRSNFGYDVRTEVFGSKGALLIGQHADTPMLRLDAEGTHTDHVYFFLERFAGAYITELQVWIAAIQAGKAEGPDGRDARAAIALAYAAEASRAERALVDCSRWSAPA